MPRGRSLAQRAWKHSPGFTLGFGLSPEALKGRLPTKHPRAMFRNAGRPFQEIPAWAGGSRLYKNKIQRQRNGIQPNGRRVSCPLRGQSVLIQ
jgi:hypothetical protein